MEQKSITKFGLTAALILALCVCGIFACTPEAPITPPDKDKDTIPTDTTTTDTIPSDSTATTPPEARTIKFRVMGVEIDSVLKLSYKAQSVYIEVVCDSTWGAVVSGPCTWMEIQSDRLSNIFTVNLSQDNLSEEARATTVVVASGGLSAKLHVVQQSSALSLSSIDSLALVEIYNALDGQYWTNNNKDVSWNLKEPVSTWQGVQTALVDGQLRVAYLTLSSMQLDGEIPTQIGALTALKTLDIRDNTIKGVIPDEIANLKELEKLYIDNNKFTGEIPGAIAYLKKLEEFSAVGNRLATFPVAICQAESLISIHLEKNEITNLPGEITSLAKLEYLYLNQNKLTTLPKGLDKMPSLIYFHAQNNQIKALPEDIGELTNLVSLNLSDNQIEGSIPTSLVDLVDLKYLYLSNNSLSGPLPQGMEKMAALETIEINNNQLSGPLHNFGLNPAVKQVQLSGNALVGDISNFFDGCPRLEWLMLGENQLEGSVPLALANIAKCPQLSYLSLSNNNLSGVVPHGFGAQLDKYSPSFNKLGFRLNGNRLSGELPADLFNIGFFPTQAITNFKFAQNLYPQQEGYLFTNMQ